jgi:hypothetical protein
MENKTLRRLNDYIRLEKYNMLNCFKLDKQLSIAKEFDKKTEPMLLNAFMIYHNVNFTDSEKMEKLHSIADNIDELFCSYEY